MNLPWRNKQTLAVAADLARDVRTYPLAAIRRRLYQLPPEQITDLTVTLAALVDLGAPLTVGAWEADADREPNPPRCPRRVNGHHNFRLEAGKFWRCRDCDRERKAQTRKAAAINKWRAAA